MPPRRALLFIPGDDRRKIEKGIGLQPDCIIMDLEDGVAASRKAAAIETIRATLAAMDFGRSEKWVRVNAVGTPYMPDDLRVLDGSLPDGIVIPKVESAEQIKRVSSWISHYEPAEQAGSIKLIAIIESAKGVVNLREIAASDPRLVALCFGAEDLAGDIGAIRTPDIHESAYARGAVVIYAKAFDLQAIDTPFITLDDEAALTREAYSALEMGYTGKLAIHPKQIAPITTVFTPNAAEIQAAQRLIAAFEQQQHSGSGAFQLDGKMVDMPMIRAATALLERAKMAGIPIENI